MDSKHRLFRRIRTRNLRNRRTIPAKELGLTLEVSEEAIEAYERRKREEWAASDRRIRYFD